VIVFATTSISQRRFPARPRTATAIAFGFGLALIPPSTWADPPDELGRLREEAAQLRRSLDQLDARIRALEARQGAAQDRGDGAAARALSDTPAAAAPAPAAAGISSLASLKKSWSQVEAGTSGEKVQSLLGKPERILTIDGSTVWYYTYPGIGRGSVFLNRDGKVSSSQSPSFGW